MKSRVFWLGLFLVVRTAAGQELTLGRALELATQGPAVQAAERAAQESQAKIGEVAALRLPQVELEAQARGPAQGSRLFGAPGCLWQPHPPGSGHR
ncbi:MAG: hypothetical protein KatS3mg007_1613 [Thermoanaerobaculum sp.]|nr:MAG: hypothetical protein KatS3mg007_1613 [Thermoanaerobaculum sp.]